jgi:hypothetical protein
MHTLQTDLLECKTKNISDYIDAISTLPKAIEESSSNFEEDQPSEISTSTLKPELNQTHTLLISPTPGIINPLATKPPSNTSTRSIPKSRGSNVPGKSGRASTFRSSGRGTRGKRGQNPRPKSS